MTLENLRPDSRGGHHVLALQTLHNSIGYGVRPLAAQPGAGAYDAIVLAVAHPQFLQLGAAGIHALGKPEHVLYDVKALLPKDETDGRL